MKGILILCALLVISQSQSQLLTSSYQCVFDKLQPMALSNSQPILKSFENYLTEFSVTVKSSQMDFRRFIFEINLKKINGHNLKTLRQYDMGLNRFTHKEERQFERIHGGLKTPSQKIEVIQNSTSQTNLGKTLKIDWLCKSGELLVRNQGKCRASYAFAATETIAAINAIYETNFFIPLSAQELISSSLTDTDGCSGSLESAFSYVKLNGVNFEWSYPYKNENSSISLPPLQVEGKIKNYIQNWNLVPNSCENVLSILQKKPIAVGISLKGLQFYSKGVFSSPGGDINHAVSLIGYNHEYGYRFKNSWGIQWGEKGYGWLDIQNNAGICNYAVNIDLELKKKPSHNCCFTP